jgi:hypothetical protein
MAFEFALITIKRLTCTELAEQLACTARKNENNKKRAFWREHIRIIAGRLRSPHQQLI